MFITPFMAAVLVGTFWTGVAATAATEHGGAGWNNWAAPSATVTTDTDHQAACSARYHSYQADTDMWYGYDGRWHVCTL